MASRATVGSRKLAVANIFPRSFLPGPRAPSCYLPLLPFHLPPSIAYPSNVPCRAVCTFPAFSNHPFPFHRRAFPCSMTTFVNALARACHVRVSFLDLKLTVTCFTRSQYPYSPYQIYLARGRLLRDKYTRPSKWVSAMFLIVAAASGCAPASAVLPRDWEVAARPPRELPRRHTTAGACSSLASPAS